MTVTKGPLGSPLPVGKTFPVLKNQTTGAGVDQHQFGVDADGILIWVEVLSVTGSVDVTVDTLGDDGSDKNVITFAAITSPTAEPIYKSAVNIQSTIRVTVNYTGSCNYNIRARGISRGGAGADDAPLVVTTDFTPILVTNPQIQNITLTTAGAESAVVLPSGTKRFRFQSTDRSKLQYAYNALATEVITVFPGNTEEEDDISEDASLTLYIKSSKDNTPVQLLFWT